MNSPATRAPRFTETAEMVLSGDLPVSPRLVAEITVSARKVLVEIIDELLASSDRSEMRSILSENLPDLMAAVRLMRLEITLGEDERESMTRHVKFRPRLLRALQDRDVDDDVVERVRLGLLAADDEALLLGLLPGGLDAHGGVAAEDAKGRLLLMAISKWAFSCDKLPAIWDDLTFEFLDTASRAYGLARSIVDNRLEDVG